MATRTRLRREKFREILNRQELTRAASVYDAVSVRLAQDVGYEVGILGGSVANHVTVGGPDLVLATLTEVAEQSRRINRASDIPIWNDADHGFGDALSVARTIQELESAGSAGASIEDTELPAPFGATARTLISLEEFEGKLSSAIAAREDPSFVVIGRTSAFATETIEDSLRRIEVCNRVGVDCIHVASSPTMEQVTIIGQATDLPLIFSSGVTDEAEAIRSGVRIHQWSHVGFSMVVRALHEAYEYQYAGGSVSALKARGASQELFDLALGASSYDQASISYLASRENRKPVTA